MRKNDTNRADFDRPSTIICENTVVEAAKLVSTSSAQVSGQFIGNLEIAKSFVISETGKVTGDVKAQFALVEGELNGNIDVEYLLHITGTGKINGDIICGTIVVDQDAVLNGTCKMREIKHQQEVETQEDNQKQNNKNHKNHKNQKHK